MAADYTIKQGETQPVLTDTLTYSDGSAVQLAGATVNFQMRSLTASQPVALTGITTIVNPVTGQVMFTPSAADTATAGQYMAVWSVLLAGASVPMSFPTVGYLSIRIEPSVTSEPQQLVSLPDVKEYLGMPATQHDRDHELLTMIEAVRPQIEHITGPVIVQTFEEWHDGGHGWINIRHKPSFGMGTSPVVTLLACSEYVGPIEWVLSIVATPDKGSIYSCMLDARGGRVVRRTAGGGVQPFPAGAQTVHVVYQAGQQQVPANVRLATLETVRVNFRTTQPAGRGRLAQADALDNGQSLAFDIPPQARRLLGATRRRYSLA
jgi:hypothetical protein